MCAQEAHGQLGLDLVLLVPVGEAPHRSIEADPGGETRARMCELSVAGDDRLAVSRLELDRPGPSYTSDTLAGFHEREPDDTLVLVLGADQAVTLPRWHEPEEVLSLAVVAVAEREGSRRDEVRSAVAGLPGAERVGFFDMPRIDISSSMVRERAHVGRPVRYLVPDAVSELIEQRALYRTPAGMVAE